MKKDRFDMIKKILSKKEIETQEQLVAELKLAGLNVTQTTVSRDITEMGLIRIKNGNGRTIYKLPEHDKFNWLISEMLVKADVAQNLVVLKVAPGAAQTVAAAIDSMRWEKLMGSIAGDDTIMLIAKNKGDAKDLLKYFKTKETK